MPKRKNSSTASQEPTIAIEFDPAPPSKRRASHRKVSQPKPDTGSTNPDRNPNVLDAPEALRASPDADEEDERMNLTEAGMDVERQVKEENNGLSLSELSEIESPVKTKNPAPKARAPVSTKEVKANLARQSEKPQTAEKAKVAATEPQFLDPEADGDEEADEEEIQAALSRPPPVNSDYLPLPWKGRLGYVSRLLPATKGVLIMLRLV